MEDNGCTCPGDTASDVVDASHLETWLRASGNNRRPNPQHVRISTPCDNDRPDITTPPTGRIHYIRCPASAATAASPIPRAGDIRYPLCPSSQHIQSHSQEAPDNPTTRTAPLHQLRGIPTSPHAHQAATTQTRFPRSVPRPGKGHPRPPRRGTLLPRKSTSNRRGGPSEDPTAGTPSLRYPVETHASVLQSTLNRSRHAFAHSDEIRLPPAGTTISYTQRHGQPPRFSHQRPPGKARKTTRAHNGKARKRA